LFSVAAGAAASAATFVCDLLFFLGAVAVSLLVAPAVTAASLDSLLFGAAKAGVVMSARDAIPDRMTDRII
jgi:hypothetical protein